MYYEHVDKYIFNTVSWCLFLDPHITTHHSNKGVQIIAMLKLCMFELVLLSPVSKIKIKKLMSIV